MSELECRPIDTRELISELEGAIRQRHENKYAFQVGLKDLDFEIDEKKARVLGVFLPFQSTDQAEQALRQWVIKPTTFLEEDETEHQVAVFDPKPVGFSGFRGCVTHSLALTDRGLFEIGRFQAMSLISQNRYWQWFIHRRLATPEQVTAWKEHHEVALTQAAERFLAVFVF